MEKTIIRTLMSCESSDDIYDTDVISAVLGIDPDSPQCEEFQIESVKSDEDIRDSFSDEYKPYPIDKFIKLLKNAKKKGSTHASIFFHGDHVEYEVYGFKYELADEAWETKRKEEERLILEKQKNHAIGFIRRLAKNNGINIEIKD